MNAIIGSAVIAAVIAAGVYWIITSISFKQKAERYTYTKDESGNDTVKDNSDEQA